MKIAQLKTVKKKGEQLKYNRGSEFDQSIEYACTEIPQWNSFVKLTYTNKNDLENSEVLQV
jgi:hypothetical protein